MKSLILMCILSFGFSVNVYIVPHSHNDAGWLETVDFYYSANCNKTLNNMFTLLSEHDSVKFCWSEVVFLQMWLKEHPEKKPLMEEFIRSGRFEIIGGGWVQNDEALMDFELLIRQMRSGLDYLSETLSVENVKIAWQLDTFGHSSLNAAVWERMGFNTLVFARIDEIYKANFI